MTREEMQTMIKEGRVIKPGQVVRSFEQARNDVRIFAQHAAVENTTPYNSHFLSASKLLIDAWMDCVNLEAEARMNAAGMGEVMFRARELAEKAHPYIDVCIPVSPSIGQPAMIHKIRGQPTVDASTLMTGAVPLWWHYIEQVTNEQKRDHGDVG